MSTITAIIASVLLAGSPTPLSQDTVWALIDAAAAATDDEHRRSIMTEAEGIARAGLARDEASVERRYDLAAVLGMRANTESGQTKVRAASEMHDHLMTILHADPAHVGARHLYGRLHAGVRRMSGVTRWIATNLLGGGTLKRASWESAEENLAYAEQHAPDVAEHHLQLARLYHDTGRRALATEELRHVLAIRAVSALDRAARAEASQLWAQLQQ